jgi:lipopolysaccharide transport system ATP-binding protein
VQWFIDTPVKHYSTGMYLRLAFAVAAHLETETLLVDEVLAVGDAAFQKKCLAKMEDVTYQGRTIFLVTHNMVAVQTLCERAIWLQDGEIQAQGLTNDVVAQYVGANAVKTVTRQVWDEPMNAPGTEKVRLHRVSIQPEGQKPGAMITINTPLCLEIEYWNMEQEAYLTAGIHLYKEGTLVFTSLPVGEPVWRGRPCPKGLFRTRCLIPADLLNTGSYGVQLVFIERETNVIFSLNDALVFEVHENARSGAWFGEWGGVVRPYLDWSTELVEPVGLSAAGVQAAWSLGSGSAS